MSLASLSFTSILLFIMSFSKGKSSLTATTILEKVSELDILYHYLNIPKLPCLISSPIRQDKHPSFSIGVKEMTHIVFYDFATGDKGGIFQLLELLWHCSYEQVLQRVEKDMHNMVLGQTTVSIDNIKHHAAIRNGSANTTLQVRVREWRQYDIDYWSSYGITLSWLQRAEILPITHTFISFLDGTNQQKEYVIRADKYAYVFVEHKENKTTMKVYQPLNKNGHKWYSKHDSSVIGLWTKVPERGEQLCICSSMKDALCLWVNTGIPAVYLQGEGYGMSDTAINVLKERYKYIYICFDNDNPGIVNGERLSKQTGFINIILPPFEGGKDISDLYEQKGLEEFKSIICPLFHKVIEKKETITSL